MPSSTFLPGTGAAQPLSTALPTSSNSRLFNLSSSSSKTPAPPPASSFLSRMQQFPLFGVAWGSKEDQTGGTTGRAERRFSFGVAKGKGKAVEHPSPTPSHVSPPLKRSKSARSSLLAATTRLSSSTPKRPKDFPQISRPVFAERNGVEEEGCFMRGYRERAPMFSMSSPELATSREESEQWASFQVGIDDATRPAAGLPHSPMVKWDTSVEKEGGPSFVPLSPQPRPFSTSSYARSGESLHGHFSEASFASSGGPDTPLESTSPVDLAPIHRLRAPKGKWDVAAFVPSLSPPPRSPLETLERTQSRSPPVDDVFRASQRAEALLKLTTPTPTTTKFSDDLSSYPFPSIDHSSTPSTPAPPRPSRPLPPVPSGTSTSLILPLPSARTLVPEDFATPPSLTRSNTVGLHPAPAPLDIDLRGRLIRARNSHPTPTSPGLTISSFDSMGSLSSPGSSRFSDWGAPSGSRKTSESSSISPSVILQAKEEGTTATRGGLYALASDRRLVESAIDVTSIPEEDEAQTPSRPPLRLKRSPSKKTSQGSPHRRSSSTTRPSSFGPSPLHDGVDVVVIPRTRPRPSPSSGSPSKPVRPYRLSQNDRSLSAGVAIEPTRNEKDEHGFRTRSELVIEPFPSSLHRASSPPSKTSPPRPRAGKRCISELHAGDRPSPGDREKVYGLGIGLPPSLLPGRTRHESFTVEPEETTAAGDLGARRSSRRVSSGAGVRTKLVLREKGQPTITYQLGECIGRGQFGAVFRALNFNTGSVVAVKRIQLEGKTPQEIDQLSNEVGLLQRLSHPSVVKYEGVVRTEHYLNIILEYAESGSLQNTLKSFGTLPEALVARVVQQILEGLSYLHEQGVVHCDLKAANILSTKNGNIKLSDFGVSLNLHAIKATRGMKAGANEANGTPNWMAPEVIELSGATTASDIWSLGATIVELIEGKPPYHDLVAMSAMFRIVEDEMPPLPEACSDELKAFLRRCFRKNPLERPTADELFDDPWLLAHYSVAKDLRPQDSLPFARRNSTDYRRPTLNFQDLPPPDDDAEHALQAPRAPFAFEGRPRSNSIDSLLSMHRAETPESLGEHQIVEFVQHCWVKSTFGRAIQCRVCREETRRHAVVCKDCGLIAHSRCKDNASSCDLRAQLLGSPTSPIAIPLARTISVVSPSDTPSSSFDLSSYNPFAKSRRSLKVATNAASPTSVSSAASPLSPASSRATAAVRQLSHALLPKLRTPDRTPPSSLSRRPLRPSNGSESSLAGTSTDDVRRVSLDVPPMPALGRRISSGLGGRKKSHSRAVSQPINQVKGGGAGAGGGGVKEKEGDCVVQ